MHAERAMKQDDFDALLVQIGAFAEFYAMQFSDDDSVPPDLPDQPQPDSAEAE